MMDASTVPLSFETWVISLKHDLKRRQAITTELSARGIPFRFFDAVNGYELKAFPPEYDRETRMRQLGFDMRPGEMGCFLSHKGIWAYAAQTGKTVLVLEDDARIHDHLFEALTLTCSLPLKWDFLRLSGTRTQRTHQLVWGTGDGFEVVEELKDPSLTTGYFLTPAGADKLLSAAQKFWIPVDNFLELRHQNKLMSLSVFPYPVTSKELGSTIGVREAPNKTIGFRLRRLWFRTWRDTVKAIWAMGRLIDHQLHSR